MQTTVSRDLRSLTRRSLLRAAAGALGSQLTAQSSRPPNIVVILADDLGYGDLSCYGSNISTPNIDRMAETGARFTQFYAASPVCSPSRAGLLTGRYPVRAGVPRVLGQDDPGMPQSEITLAQLLRGAGYATSCIGKWHLGATEGYRPTERGFDEYFGIPYSNDMWPRPLLYNTTVLEQPAQLSTLTRRYTERAIDFMSRSRSRPFFLYFPHTFPHIPLAASPDFQGKSGQGLYGDTVQELDWSVGQVLDALKSMDLDDDTLVLFTSDNGPWHQGSPGRLRGRKGDTYEGGMRAPFIANWTGRIAPGQTVRSMATMLDIFPTVAKLAGANLPDRIIDGVDIWPVLSGQKTDVDRDAFLYFNDEYLQCARLGPWKLHISRFDTPMFVPAPEGRRNLRLPRPELYNVISDPEEAYDRSERNARIAADLQDRVERLIRTFPSGVIATYNDTMGTDVEETPIASLPVAKGH